MPDLTTTDHLTGSKLRIKLDEPAALRTIQKIVSEAHGLTRADLLGPCRLKKVAHARQLAMWIARTLLGTSYPQIGKAFGNRDHSTAMYAVKAVASRAASEYHADAPRVQKILALREEAERALAPKEEEAHQSPLAFIFA